MRLTRVIRGLWNYYILGRRPVLLNLDEKERELSAALREWDMEFKGRSSVQAKDSAPGLRYVWKKTSWFVVPEWQLLDISTDRYIATVTKYGRHDYAAMGATYAHYRSRRSAMGALERGLS